MPNLLVFWNKLVQKVHGESLAIYHAIYHEGPFLMSGKGMCGQERKENKMLDET